MKNQINYAALTLDEIIFIDRNQAYGAFELRHTYHENVKRALLGMLLIPILLAGYQIAYNHYHPTVKQTKVLEHLKITEIKIPEVKLPKQVQEIEPPAAKPNKPLEPPKGDPNAATVKSANLVPTRDERANSDTIATNEDLTDKVLSDHTSAGNTGQPVGEPEGTSLTMTVKAAPQKNTIYNIGNVEVMPEFPGGETALMKYLSDHIQFPEVARENNEKGKVVVGFVIDEQGKVTNIKILKGASAAFDRESARVVSSLPRFKPGMQSGQPVRVSFVLPINYQSLE